MSNTVISTKFNNIIHEHNDILSNFKAGMESLVSSTLDLDESCLDLKLEENEIVKDLLEALESLHKKELFIKGQCQVLRDTQEQLLNGSLDIMDLEKHFNSQISRLNVDLSRDKSECDYLQDLKTKRLELRGVTQDHDDDIQLVSEKESFICPITQLLLVDPVRSAKCGHIYSRKAILDLMDGRREIECPKAACPYIIRDSDLKVDKKIVRLVASEKRRLNLEKEQEKSTYMAI